ncbi:hypothetical protein TVAG_285480 [Trichomonas vaginalis G3]|uniref:Uncharacterized protein n=1 Tax=Trichomonas vaginalis (strain ATCC PRA-98 / G3) TaxID=412133 RepID=A2FUA6_TRIV3|nr:hypothetical protein TVAGG3_0919330 [Trichomonas vaginalis G3]EAX91496.1 hypothetical protein TVAG_285480 [Trichomonas vaginalis G3]KAI5485046.1 hypothetical protein TVAGG3_0919330 [Trichomonas vaginalis G3]|eukprot:XP_001304426.1 hypothetical protein [Trichomonas vaginalis G3]
MQVFYLKGGLYNFIFHNEVRGKNEIIEFNCLIQEPALQKFCDFITILFVVEPNLLSKLSITENYQKQNIAQKGILAEIEVPEKIRIMDDVDNRAFYKLIDDEFKRCDFMGRLLTDDGQFYLDEDGRPTNYIEWREENHEYINPKTLPLPETNIPTREAGMEFRQNMIDAFNAEVDQNLHTDEDIQAWNEKLETSTRNEAFESWAGRRYEPEKIV